MTDPVLHLLAGPNGAGKSTFYAEVLQPVTHLEFVNTDMIAAQQWPGDELRSFVTETVFSHPSKVQLLRDAEVAGYRTTLHVVAVPVELAVVRVKIRAHLGGHDVPEDKIRERYTRLWGHLAEAVTVVDEAFLYDNSVTKPSYRRLAVWVGGVRITEPDWPDWLPPEIRTAGRG